MGKLIRPGRGTAPSSRYRRRRLAVVATTTSLALALAACGGDDDDDDDAAATSEAPSETEAPDTAAPATTETPEVTEAPATTEAPDATEAPATTEASSEPAPEPTCDVEAAQEEGAIHAYWAVDDVTAAAIAEAIKTEYDIDLTFERIPDSAALAARFKAESDAGASGADIIVNTDTNFIRDAVATGYLLPTAEWGVANLANLPEALRDPDFATVGLFQLNNALVNTDNVAEEDYPSTWADIVDPKWADRVLSNDPRLVVTTLSIFNQVASMEGDEWITKLGENNPTWVQSLVSGAQSVAAGEEDIAFGIGQIHLNPLFESAPEAPVKLIRLDGPAFGAEWNLTLATKAQHPNAACVFADWLFTPEGQQVFNRLIGPAVLEGVTIEGFDPLPPDYVRLPPVPDDRKSEILDLLGLAE